MRDFVGWDSLSHDRAARMTTEELVEHQMLLGPANPTVERLEPTTCEEVVARGRQLMADGHDLVVLVIEQPTFFTLLSKKGKPVDSTASRLMRAFDQLRETNEEVRDYWDGRYPSSFGELLWAYLWAESDWNYSMHQSLEKPLVLSLAANKLIGLCVRCGAADDRVLKISQRVQPTALREKRPNVHEGVVDPGWHQLAVRTEDKRSNRARFLLLEPADTHTEFNFSPFYVKGEFKVVQRVNNPRKAREAWRDFCAAQAIV